LIMTLIVIGVVRLAGTSGHSVPQAEPGPVLLVPGYGGNVQSLQPLVTALRSAGRTAVIVEPLGDGTGDLQGASPASGRGLLLGYGRTPGQRRLTSLDTPAGGVVARLWVRDDGGAEVARRVLTIGSPHHGSRQAALGAEFAGGCPAGLRATDSR
jgi:triacylglycerol esterase/lipase EstA (alpha/beta hydrolase family)